MFTSTAELRERVIKAFNEFAQKKSRPRAAPRPRPTAGPPSNDAVCHGYVDWLRDECEKVVLLGLDLRDRRNVRLGQVYVPALTSIQAEPGSRASSRSRFLEPSHEPLLHRLGRQSLYVPGAPGSGKSTFCRWLARVTASGGVPPHSPGLPEEFAETMPRALHGSFPFLCLLRQWASDARWLAGNGQWLQKQLEDGLAAWIDAARPGGLTSSAFREALQRKRCVLIFDGVDEIPERTDNHYPRRNFLTGLADALPQWAKAGHRVLLTSRPYGVEDPERQRLGLELAELTGLPRELQEVFVRRWYAAAGTRDGKQKAKGLIEHLDGRRDLDELRPNPMLLAALCVKYDEDMRLPGDLYRLYSAVTDQVLYKRFETEQERDLARLRLAAVALAMHQGSSHDPRTTPAAEVSFDEADDALTELARTDRTSERASTEASERRERLLSSSGLLLPRANRRVAFYHFSFQEFLAAVRLRRVTESSGGILARHMATAGWRRTLRFLFCAIADQASPELALREYAVLLDHLAPDRLQAEPNPALLLADCLEVGHARGWNLQDFSQRYRHACDDALTRVPPPARAYLWQVLGRIGLDDRRGVGVRNGLPDIDWVDVPAGDFQFAEKPRAVTLPTFRIARYPITNDQFQRFVDDGGFETDEWWQWSGSREPPEPPVFPYPNHPRETVSWFDAMAFCRWLESRLRARGDLSGEESVRLPTEQESEKAARGEDGREYPWGPTYESGRANIDEAFGQAGPYYVRQTSAVGIYPEGASPHGAHDMAGNVCEWCLDTFDLKERGKGGGRMVRGGSWGLARDFARCDFRVHFPTDYRNFYVGFRVVRGSPSGCRPSHAA